MKDEDISTSLNCHFQVRVKYANFVFYLHLKMTSERSKRHHLLSLIFITKKQKQKNKMW